MTYFDAALAKWSAAAGESWKPIVTVYYVERRKRDWRTLWLTRTWTSEIIRVSHHEPIKVRLHTGDDA